MKVALVAAVARNGVIGAGGALPWRIADDLLWFKKTTIGKPVVMGRKTFESIGKPLPGRDNIVITRKRIAADGIQVADGIEAALGLGRSAAEAAGADEVCVIGGGEIYAQALRYADRIYLTRVKADIAGDARFPTIRSKEWSERQVGAAKSGPKNQYDCSFFILDRIGAVLSESFDSH
jgi:dihydrofolate reductase